VIGKVPARLNILTLGVRDLQKVRTFYEALGWESLSEGEEFARFQTGGATLALFSLDLLAGEANMAPAPAQEGAGRFAGFTCAVLVEEEGMVDDAMGAVREAGGRVLAEPVAREWGGRSGYFADPECNVWELAWMPGATFDERGELIWP
jgi:catechol 2,3-dioxygenase-like lactoylglutathione lyase family enzyme